MTDAPFIDPGPDVYAEGFRRGVYTWLDDYIVSTQEMFEDAVRSATGNWLDDHTFAVEQCITEAIRDALTTWLATDEGKRIVRRAFNGVNIDGDG
ncbi:MAG: hypothetical protein ACYDCS_07705 [Candidatus Dormibacteria bacterium]